MIRYLKSKMLRWIQILQLYTNRLWYAPLIGFLAAIDNIILIIPNDGILISSSMLKPQKWFIFALWVSIGSTFGAFCLAALLELKGLPWILELYPGLDESQSWLWMHDFFETYGLILVFAVAIAPIVQQPAIILASLAETPLLQLCAVVFVGRFIKFLIMSYVASHAPRLLSKMWGIKDELKEVGAKIGNGKSA